MHNSELEVDEALIDKLEELDILFSKINALLRKILERFIYFKSRNLLLNKNLSKLIEIFKPNEEEDLISEKENTDELNLSFGFTSSIADLKEEELPAIFRGDKNISLIYEFIKKGGAQGVSFDEIITALCKEGGLERDRLEIYLHLFISKRVIKCKGEIFKAV